MKHLSWLILLSSSLILSCQKSSESARVANYSRSLMAKTQVLEMQGDKQKMAYRLLNAEEKASLWREKLEKALMSDTKSEEQKNFIGRQLERIKPSLFTIGSAENRAMKIDIPVLRKEAEALFGERLSFVLFGQLNGSSPVPGVASVAAAENCECCLWDNWCPKIKETGNRRTCYYTSGPGPYILCLSSELGCGWLWMAPCNGMCA